MLSDGLTILDKLAKLATFQRERNKALLSDFLCPLYEDMKTIHQDYIRSMTEVKESGQEEKDYGRLLSHLVKSKTQLEHLRVSVHQQSLSLLEHRRLPEDVFEFIGACLDYFDPNNGVRSFLNQKCRSHKVLRRRMKKFWENRPEYKSEFSSLICHLQEFRHIDSMTQLELACCYIDQTIEDIRKRWESVSRSYAECKVHFG
jgi:hypothetical protein